MYRLNLLVVGLLWLMNAISQDKKLEKKIDRYLLPFVNSKDFAGNILIAREGKIIVNKSYGLADIESSVSHQSKGVFHVASVSKPFTAILIMKLQEEGKLSTADKLNKFIPDFPNGNKITIHHLLSQTSGLPDYNRFTDYYDFSIKPHTIMETIDWFKNRPLQFEPGKQYGYSNANFVTLAAIIEVVTSTTYEAYLKRTITGPLEMHSTGDFTFEDIIPNRVSGYDIDASTTGLINASFYDKSFKRGSGALYSTATDLLKLDQALYGTALLSENSKKQMFAQVDSNGYGYGWIVNKRFDKYNFQEHDGKSPGFSALFSRYPDEKTTIIFQSNINSGLFNSIRRDLAAIVFNEPYDIPEAKKYVKLSEGEMKRFTGTYVFPSGFKYVIKLENDNLLCYFGGSKKGDLLSPLNSKTLFLRSRFDQLTLNNLDGKTVIEYKERAGVTICPKEED